MPSNNTTTQNTQSGGPFASSQIANQSATQDSNQALVRGPYDQLSAPLNQYLGLASSNAGYADPSYSSGLLNPAYGAIIGAANSFAPYTAAGLQNANTGAQNNGVLASMQPGLAQLGNVGSGQNAIGTADQYQQLFNQAGTNLGGLAGDTSGALTPVQQRILDDNANRMAIRQASLYSGTGRYGSAGMGIGMARGIAETNDPLIAAFNQANIGNSLQANSLMGQQQLGATAGLTGVQGQNIANQMNAANSQLSQLQNADQRAQAWNAQIPLMYQAAMQPSKDVLAARQGMVQAPWAGLQNYGQALGLTGPLTSGLGTAVTSGSNVANSSNQASTSGFQQNQGFTQNSTPTPWTTYAGLGVAGLGLLSDRRLKTDITKLGKDQELGLNMYAYRYRGDPKSYPKMVGPMAQEVQKKYPEHVGQVGGILYIK